MSLDLHAIASAASLLCERRQQASHRVEAQLTLLGVERFVELASLAGLISERDDLLHYAKSREAEYLRQQLANQVNEMICELVRHRDDVAHAKPLHRLPAPAQAATVQECRDGNETDDSAALQQVFPTRLEGWLTIPKGAVGTKPRQRDYARTLVRPRRAEDIPPAYAFESAREANPEAIDTHLEVFLDSLRENNGVLPIVVRHPGQQRHLRELEYYQIEAGFRESGRSELMERGSLRKLCERVMAAETVDSGDSARVTAAADLDQSLPLAVLWTLALQAFAAVTFANDRQRAERLFKDGDRECRPLLTIADVEKLGIALNPTELRSVIALLRSLPPNSFIEIFDKSKILSHRKVGEPLQDWLLGVKDVFAFGPTTGGSSILDPFDSQLEATVVSRLRSAGCLVVGKTNLDEFALGSSCETSAFKPTPGCPVDRLRVAGGSSGGSASAVAAGLVRIALGSDTAGSIRVPAAYCGVVGWKPSYGVVSRYGLLSLSSGLDVVGLVARNMDDCTAAAAVIIGEDLADETTAGAPNLDAQCTLRAAADIQSLEVGIPIEYFLNLAHPLLPLYKGLIGTQDWEGLREFPARIADNPASDSIERDVPGALDDRFRTIPDYWDIFRGILERITELGWTWKLVSLPHTWLSIPAYFAFSRAELASSLHRYDGTGFGARSSCEFQELKSRVRLSQTRRDHFGIQPKLRILMGIHALQLPLVIKKENANPSSPDDCLLDDFLDLAKRARQAIYSDFGNVFRDVDVLLTPVVNVAAPPYGGIVNTIAQQRLDELTVPANHAGVPAVSLPWGTITSLDDPVPAAVDCAPSPRLPTAVQVIAPRFEDVRLLAVAKRLETLRDKDTSAAQEQ